MKSCEEMYKEIQPLIEADNLEGAIHALENMLQSYPEYTQAHHDLVPCILNAVIKKRLMSITGNPSTSTPATQPI